MKARIFTKETIGDMGVVEREFPRLEIGDTIAVSQRIKEGDKERIQIFEGDIIAMHKNGASSTFTVRKIAAGAIAVERIFPIYAPFIEEIKFVRKGKVRRAKLYYIRGLEGKAARIERDIETQASAAASTAAREAKEAKTKEAKK